MTQINDGTAIWDVEQIANSDDVKDLQFNQTTFPAWWLYRGTGKNGNYTPANGATFKFGNYTNITINSGVILNIYRFTVMVCSGTFTLNGTIDGNGKGADGGAYISSSANTGDRNPGETGSNAASGGGPSTYATAFGYAKYQGSLPETVQSAIEYFPAMPEIYGGGGSSGYDGNHPGYPGGAGGAGLIVLCNRAVLNGTISCNGAAGDGRENAGSSGGGGGILIIANSVSGSGKFSHTGAYEGWHKVVEIDSLI